VPLPLDAVDGGIGDGFLEPQLLVAERPHPLSILGLGINSFGRSNGSNDLAGNHGQDELAAVLLVFPFYH
jgi:hypothetical protein